MQARIHFQFYFRYSHMQIHHVFIPYEIAQKAVTHTTICIDKQVKKLEERRENVMKEIEELGVKA